MSEPVTLWRLTGHPVDSWTDRPARGPAMPPSNPRTEYRALPADEFATLTRERDEAVADRDRCHAMLTGQCETCDGTGIMEVEVAELPPYGDVVYADEKCAECGGCGKGWVGAIMKERDEARTALAEARALLNEARVFVDAEAKCGNYVWRRAAGDLLPRIDALVGGEGGA